jgi:DNA-binding MarR family transcriptional regulator
MVVQSTTTDLPARRTAPGDGPGLAGEELAAWRGMQRVHAHLIRELDAELTREHALSLSSYDVLVQLAEAPERRRRMSELAECVLLTPSGLTRLVDRLCRDGLVERSRCSSDARGAFAVLTVLGAERLAAARATHIDGVRRLFASRLESAELRRLAADWERIVPGAAA